MKTIEGNFFDGLRPVPIDARIDFDGRNAKMTAGDFTATYAASQLIVSPRIVSARRFIDMPDGGQFVCRDQDYLDALPQESPSEGIVAWLENRWQVALACVVIIAITLLSGYFFGLPKLAKHIAQHIPKEKEQALGVQVLAWFDDKEWLAPSALDISIRENIHTGYKKLCGDLPFRDFYRLEFRSGKVFGPNAFALPGGIIVVTDELVELSRVNEEVLAVLAHEIGHVELRHTMRSILQNSIIAAAVAAVTSDAATLSVAVSGLPALVAQRKYSRAFEADADSYAFSLLLQNGYSPELFAAIMERLSTKSKGRPTGFGYLATHPITEERVRRARQAAAENRTKP